MRTSRRSPPALPPGRQCRPAQLIRKSAANSPAVVAAVQPAALAAAALHARAGDHARAARRQSPPPAPRRPSGNPRCLPGARAAPPRRPRAARSRASRSRASQRRPSSPLAMPRSCRSRRRGTSASSTATTSLPQISCGIAVLAAELHHLPDARRPPAAPSPTPACSTARSAARRCCGRSGAGRRRPPFPARKRARPESARSGGKPWPGPRCRRR